jgi:hypothetical protein
MIKQKQTAPIYISFQGFFTFSANGLQKSNLQQNPHQLHFRYHTLIKMEHQLCCLGFTLDLFLIIFVFLQSLDLARDDVIKRIVQHLINNNKTKVIN